MKVIACFLLILISCNDEPYVTEVEKKNPPITKIEWLDTAKALSRELFFYLDQVESKKMTRSQLTELSDPLELRLDSIRKLLSPSEIDSLNAYRLKIVNNKVDRK